VKSSPKKARAVVVAADVCSYSIPVVNLAVQIAASVGSGVRGLFVEDPELLALIGSPLTREISLTTGSARPSSNERMQRMLRTVSRQFESTLQREAQALQITWSYEYVHGRVEDVGLRTDRDIALAILGKTGLHRVDDGPAGRIRRVLLVYDPAVRPFEALAVLLRQFGSDKKQVTLVAEAPLTNAAQELRRGIGDSVTDFALLEIDRSRLAELLERAGAGFDFAILSMRENSDQLARMLKALRCPVILVA
jgi:hypothetical protein